VRPVRAGGGRWRRVEPSAAAVGAVGAALFAAVALSACHPRRPPPDLSAEPAALLAEVRTAQARVQTVQGRARVGVDGPGGAGTLDQFLAAEKPGRVRLEAYDFFGNVVAVLAVDAGALALYDAKEKVFYRGPATPANLARLVPVPLTPEALAMLLCGSAPLLDGEPTAASPGDGVMKLELRRGDLVQRLEIGAGAAVVSSRVVRLGPDGEAPVDLDADFAHHERRAGAQVPKDVEARAAGAGVALSLHWRERVVNEPVDPALWKLEAPKGARLVDLGAAAP